MVEALLDEQAIIEALLPLESHEVFLYNILNTDHVVVGQQIQKLRDSGLYGDIRTIETTYHPDETSALNYVAVVAILKRIRNETV